MPVCAGALLLAGCHAQIQTQIPHSLRLSVEPPPPSDLASGTIVSVHAIAEPFMEMAWVSGTVGIMGAPVAGFKRAADGSWMFRTMVPPMVTVPAGTYHIKAWGRSKSGEELKATMNYEVQ